MYCLSEVRTRALPRRSFRVRSSRPETQPTLDPVAGPLPPTPDCGADALRALLRALPDAVLVVDAGDRVLFATPATQRILQLAPDELVGRPLAFALVPAETTSELDLQRPDGTTVVVEMRIGALTWEGRPARVVTLRDVSERSRLEDAVRAALAGEVGRRTCARIAADYRDLLTTLLCGAQLLEEASRDDPELGGLATRLVASAREATQLTRRLVSVSGEGIRTGPGADLNERVRAFESRLRPLLGEDMGLEVDLDPIRPQIALESSRIDEILAQLIQNACDAIDHEGRISITGTVRDVSEGEARGIPPGRHAVLAIRDNGRGMSRDIRERLFEPFFSTKTRRPGRGLGLAQVYGLVEQAGGFIDVESAEGEGTRVELLLPLVEEDDPDRVADSRSRTPALEGRTILLAEDEEGIRRLLAEVLEQAGARVVLAADVREAEAILADPTRALDLLISDVRMPGGTGLDLLRSARAGGRDLPAILMSGYTAHMPLGSVPPGDTEFLPKPFLPGALLELAQGMVSR